jgi:nucleoside-diphosphate-sugar epimerase
MPPEKRPVSIVTGCCGFIGSHMVELLNSEGHTIIATDIETSKLNPDLKDNWMVVERLCSKFVPADLTDPDTLKGLFSQNVDYIFHTAAVFSYSASFSRLFRVNVQGTLNLLTTIRDSSIKLKRFVLWGAGGVYGFKGAMWLPLTEESPIDPPNSYLRSKWYQEKAVMEFCSRFDIAYTIIRPTTVYGPRCRYGSAELIKSVASMKLLPLPTNFKFPIPLVHVRDVCSAALFLANSEAATNETFNVDDDSNFSYKDFVKCIAGITGGKILTVPPVPVWLIREASMHLARILTTLGRVSGKLRIAIEPDTANFIGRQLKFSNRKLKNLGYKFLYPYAEKGLSETIKWYREKGML